MKPDDAAAPTTPLHPSDRRDGLGLRLLCGLSGTVAGGLVVLALGLAVVRVAAGNGPGGGFVLAHAAAAVGAVALQIVADRVHGPIRVLAALLVVTMVAIVVWFGWLL